MDSELSDSGSRALAQAPAVTYPLSRPTFLVGVLVMLLSLALCVDLAWLAMASTGDWRPWVGLLATAGVGGFCWWQGPLTRFGRLSWDGGDWWWEEDAGPHRGAIHRRLDTQSGLLIRFVADSGASHWFWLSQASEPGRWLAMRRAIYADAHRRADATSPQRAAHP